MGGRIGFESEPGHGSTFWFDLELAVVEGAPADVPAMPPHVRRARVLIVDDNATSRTLLERQVGKLGLQAEGVASAEAARARLQEAPPGTTDFRLVLLDWHMPGMSGFELAAALRADPARAGLPLVLLSSAGPGDDPTMAQAASFGAMLTKPVREEQLHRCIVRLLGEAELRPAAPLPSPAEALAAPGLRVLLAEDNPANQTVARMVIEKMGHQVDLASHGQQALAMLAERTYDAVLMDCQMPVLDGYEVTWRIRSGALAGIDPRVTVIALTAYAMPGDREKCLEAGMDDYVSKPLRAAELRDVLARRGSAKGARMGRGPALATPVAPEAVVDPETMAQLRALPGRHGPSLWPEMVAVIGRETPARLADCVAALASGRSKDLADLAHRLAGSASAIGVEPMRDAALALERAAGEAEVAAEKLASLRAEWERVREALVELTT
jgi:CheY-like chemotaxis protein